ncbi:phage/plasmid primase, P4 family [Pirellulaceae bacterium SH449]
MAAQISDVKDKATGQWLSILSSVGPIPTDCLTGRHGPCPKCGGKDRWRLTSEETGSAVCNQCGKFGDGIAVLEWFTGKSTFDVVEAIAKHLGIASTTSKKKKTSKKSKANEPYWLQQLHWTKPAAKLLNQWFARKFPINLTSLEQAAAQFGTYRGKDSIIALPIHGPNDAVVGYTIYNATGGMLEYYPIPGEQPEFIKVKNLINKGDSGWMGRYLPGEGLVVKTEGPTDMLAMLTIAPADVSVICNPHGATETPIPWLVDKIRGRRVYTVHDCDYSGQSGATYVESNNRSRPGWSVAFASTAAESRNVVLPYPIEDSHGKDLRDWICEKLETGQTPAEIWTQFLELAEQSEVLEPDDEDEKDLIEEIDSPMRLARINLEQYRRNFGGTLKYWKDEWWRYKAGKYSKIAKDEIKGKIVGAIQSEFERDFRDTIKAGGEATAVRKISATLTSNVIECTKSLCLLPGSVPQPCWLEDESQPHWISMTNGILDLQAIFEGRDTKDHLRPHSEKWFATNRLDYPYDPSAKCPRWMDCIEYSMEGDHERIALLQEWCGYMLTSSNYMQKFLALMGDGGNGKSVFMAVIVALLGQDNCGHVPLENFSGRFDLGTVVGKAANICNDVGEIDSLAEGILKQFTGGDPMQFDRKNLSPIVCRPSAKLILSFNKAPKIKDRSKGMWRRMLLVPFNKSVPADRIVRHMDQAEYWIDSGEISGILNWAIVGLQRLQDQKDFTRSSASEAAIDDYKRENNPVLDFFDDYLEVSEGSRIYVAHLFGLYQHWCASNNYRPMSLRNFGVEMKRKYGEVKEREGGSKREYFYRNLNFTTTEIAGRETDEKRYGI